MSKVVTLKGNSKQRRKTLRALKKLVEKEGGEIKRNPWYKAKYTIEV